MIDTIEQAAALIEEVAEFLERYKDETSAYLSALGRSKSEILAKKFCYRLLNAVHYDGILRKENI